MREVVVREAVEEVKEVEEGDVDGEEEGSEDLDSDDDDLPAYDMSGDTVVTEETKVPILYLRDVLHHLAQPETVQGLRCLQLVPQLAQTHLLQVTAGYTVLAPDN